jgi:hypothetical protein
MHSISRLALLGTALAPYLALVGVDAWMHERARRVPPLEQAFHAIAAVLFAGFVGAVFFDATTLALILLGAYAVCAAGDELGFHRHLSVRERRVHFLSYAALALFLSGWAWIEAAA